MSYVELPSDHEFSAFLASLTPGKVLRDRERSFSTVERKRQKHLRALAHAEGLRKSGRQFSRREIEIAIEAMRKESA